VAGQWKPITFAPKRGAVLLCDFDMGRVPHEIDKRRQVIVFSLTSLNHKHALEPGLCSVVPASSEEPKTIGPEDVLKPAGKYPRSEFLDNGDMARIAAAIKHALGIP
jgi:hypothetical protein